MLEMGPCLAVPHSDLLRMVPIPGMVFSAEFKHKELLLLFWGFFFWFCLGLFLFCFGLVFCGFFVCLFFGFWFFVGFFVSFFVFKGEPNSSSAARH